MPQVKLLLISSLIVSCSHTKTFLIEDCILNGKRILTRVNKIDNNDKIPKHIVEEVEKNCNENKDFYSQ
tara:strand:+ start:1682 stop:1888 length:207 start_codon:yes stop_codon:yes gene_type:complete